MMPLWLSDLLSMGINIAIWCAGVVALYDGTRQIRPGNRSWRVIAPVALVATVSLVTGVGFLVVYFAPALPFPFSDSTNVPNNNPTQYAKVTPEQANEFSRTNAEWTFLTNGVLLKYFDENGEWKIWQPTQEQLFEREQVLATQSFYSHIAHNELLYSMCSLSIGIGAFLGWRAAGKSHAA